MKDDSKKNGMEMKKNKDGNSNKKPSFPTQLWNKYIKRLNKITNGKPQCCK